MQLAPSPPGRTVWDPRDQPYITPACKGGRHDECPGGLDYYPQGITGKRVLVPCACEAERCTCTERSR